MSDTPRERTIRTPAELAALLRELKQAVAAGVLEQLPADQSSFATDLSIASIDDAGPWPDYLEVRFRTPGGSTVYKLAVETYHGTGGTWGPE